MSTVYIPPYIPLYIPSAGVTTAARAAETIGSFIGIAIANIPSAEIQKVLTRFQATRLIGPLIGSPIKALYSTAQIIFGIALCVLFGPVGTLTNFRVLKNLKCWGVYHTTMGMSGLATSIFNFTNMGGPVELNEVVLVHFSSFVHALGANSQNPAQTV